MTRPGDSSNTAGAPSEAEQYVLRLFVAGDEMNSTMAKTNLQQLCETHLRGRYEIQIVDVFEDFKTALECGVLVTPTLLLVAPPPPVTILGNLSDTPKVLLGLRLMGGA